MARLLLLVLITQAASWAERSTVDPKPSSVPIPTNLKIKAYNLDTVLYWNYSIMEHKPVFTVQVKVYGEDEWSNACNTSHHYCNIFDMIKDPHDPLWARVKARVGQEESAYAESEEFILCQHGKVGPPKLQISHKEDRAIVNIFHPLIIVNGEERGTIFGDETCYIFKYEVYEKINNGRLIIDRMFEQDDENCDETQCNFSIPVSSQNFEYCISAEGISHLRSFKTEMSEEVCITISESKSIKDSVWIPAVASVLLFLVLALVVVCWNFKKINPFKKESIMLPKSLVSVVKNASLEAKSELKYVSPINYEPIVLENEKVIWEEQLSPATISSMQSEDHLGKAEHRDLPSETQVGTTEENTPDVAPGSPLTSVRRGDSVHSGSNQSEPCIVALNSYHSRNGSDSGLMESSLLSSSSEPPPSNKTGMKTEEPEPITLRNTTTSFGYDKPHVLVDVLVDEVGKESLIGYRVTADSKEFS